jgi:hypothetical protein
MGSQQDQLDDERETAVEIAIRAGVLARCEIDQDVVPGSLDDEAAYKLGNYLITQDDPSVAVFGGDRRAMTDAIKFVIGEHSMAECWHRAVLAKND